jgi:hypothetical protein
MFSFNVIVKIRLLLIYKRIYSKKLVWQSLQMIYFSFKLFTSLIDKY